MSKIPSILVVDDNHSMATSLRDVLELKGFHAFGTDSAAQALEILRDHPVDIMLTDVIMPEMNGLDLFLETKKLFPRLTTIFMTAYSADALIEKGMAAGVKTVLNKPVDINFLLQLLAAILKGK